MFFVRKSFVKR